MSYANVYTPEEAAVKMLEIARNREREVREVAERYVAFENDFLGRLIDDTLDAVLGKIHRIEEDLLENELIDYVYEDLNEIISDDDHYDEYTRREAMEIKGTFEILDNNAALPFV